MKTNREIRVERDALISFIWSQRAYLRHYVAWRFISVLLITPFPIITQRIVDIAIPEKNAEAIAQYTTVALALLLVHFVTRRLAVITLSVRMQTVMRRLRALVFNKLNFMHFGFLDSAQTGRLLSKYAIDTSNIEFTMIVMVTVILPEILRATLLLVSLAYINYWLLLIALISLPLFALIRFYFFRRLEDTNRSVRLAREKMTGQANEFISAIRLVRSFGQEKNARRQMSVLSDAYSEERVEQMRLNQAMGYILFTAITAITVVAVGFCGWLVIAERLSVGAMVALAGALPICLQPINLFAQFSIQYTLGAEGYLSIKELVDSRYVENWRGHQRLDVLQGDIKFDAVTFAYEKEKPPAIRSFSAHITPGEHVAFVGNSGSGKSTLVSLMLGFYAADEGQILIDGLAQKDIDIRIFRRSCAIVMQDNLLLSGSLLDNIRFGQPNATMEQVRDAASQANALAFIEELPDGFETKVGERGMSLSGGQRQRIAIARALLRNPKVLILDEATSALDYESEKLVQEAINRLATGRTTLSIAHRLSTIRNADRIIVLNGGRKVSEGTWDELANQPGEFKTLLDSQR